MNNNNGNEILDKGFLKAIIMVGHSNAGKSSICSHITRIDRNIKFSVSATTRPRRDNEVNLSDYIFLAKNQFEKFINDNMFIEYDFQNTGHYYGTLKNEVEKVNRYRQTVLFDVNPAGADKLRTYFGDSAITLFVTVPGKSVEEKQKILTQRALGSDIRDGFERRLHRVHDEIRWAEQNKIDHWVENADLQQACQEVSNIVAFAKREMRKLVCTESSIKKV
jgi:guanylate kinase